MSVETAAPQARAVAEPQARSQDRLLSLDALRGWDMFWIMGGDHLIRSLQKIYDCPVTKELNEQMEHVEYAGFHFYDLIFPLFVFMAGVAIPFSVPRMIEKQGRAAALKRIVIRGLLLFLLGVIYMGGVSNGFKEVWFAGVLQRIGIAYLFAALIFVFFRSFKALAATTIALLVGYWLLMTFVSVPALIMDGAPAGFWPPARMDFSNAAPPSYDHGKSLAYAIDQCFLPGKRFEGTILSTLAAVANALLGVLAGLLVISKTVPQQKKSVWLIVAGLGSLLAGCIWGLQFPVIKILWTSSYVLVTCGISAILLGIFYQIIDVWKFQKWAQPLVWIGMNAITIYLVSALVGFRNLAGRFVGGDIAASLGSWADFVRSVVALVMVFAVVRFLYNRKIFLRL